MDRGLLKTLMRRLNGIAKAADQGLPDAQNNLGLMYKNGLSVTQDFNEALKWYRKAANRANRTLKTI